MSNFFDTATLIFAFVWVICMGASFIAVLDWDGIIEAKRLKLLVPAAIVTVSAAYTTLFRTVPILAMMPRFLNVRCLS